MLSINDVNRIMNLTKDIPVSISLTDSGWHVKYNGSEIMHTMNSFEITSEAIYASIGDTNKLIKEQRKQLIRDL